MKRALFVVLCLSLAAHADSPTAGKVTAQVTKAEVTRGSGRLAEHFPAIKDTDLHWNDLVKTDKSGRVRIELNDQSILTLGQKSQLRVVKHDAKSQQTSLQLVYGKIRCQIVKLTTQDSSFQLRTPTAVAGVIGTDFGADDSIRGQTHFICITGKVRIYTPDMKSYVDCGPGQMLTVTQGQPLPQPEAAPADHVHHWQHATEPGDPEPDAEPAPHKMKGMKH